jgi:glycosyltransferase involved in cell wall biosynthesis
MTSANSALRVLHLSNTASNFGNGIVNVAVDLSIEQASRGVAVAFVSSSGGWTGLMQEHGVRIYTLPFKGIWTAPKALLKMWRVLREFRPDIVHAHMRKALFLVWPLARLLRIPIVLHLHNIHNEHMGTTGLADRVIAVSQAVSSDLESGGTPADRIRIVMNGTLGTKRLPAETTPLPLQHPAIVSVAGISVRKGMYELIEAFNLVSERYPGAHLYLVGGGSIEEAKIREFAAQTAGADRIHFEQFRADPRTYLTAADVFVLASRREAFGLALIEARAAGCAIVATNVDGIPEIVEQGKTGLLVPPNNPSSLAEAISLLLDNADLRSRLQSQAARNLERYAVERMSADTEVVYRELLSPR